MDIKIHTLDLEFQSESHAIAAYLLESKDGLILIESGPETTFDILRAAIAKLRFRWQDVKHVFITHVHFDHAGAAWKFAEVGALIYVHPKGLPHLEEPERLWQSAARIYGNNMDVLWGNMQPIARRQLVSAPDGAIFDFGAFQIKAHDTPGHASHHNCYQINEILFTGDVAGVKIDDGPVMPPCPPPDINVEAWLNSIHKMRVIAPKKIYLTHYGLQEDVLVHLNELELILEDWTRYMKVFFDNKVEESKILGEFQQYVYSHLRSKGCSEELIQTYEYANPSWMSVSGLMRYWSLKDKNRL